VSIEDVSPFPYYGPLDPERLTGREALVHDLSERLLAHRVTALLGPRRYGKTSVLRRVAADLAGVGPETLWIDLYELTSMADLAGRLDDGLAAVQGRLGRTVRAIAASLTIKVGAVSVDLSRGNLKRPDAVLVARALMNVIVRTSEQHRLLLVLDEFSGIAGVAGAAGVMRTALQHHYDDISIVFAGSQPSTMRMLFTDRAQPFFAQADIVEIPPLDDGAIVDLLHEGFEVTGRSVGRVDGDVVRFAEGHPQRAMQLADALWRHTPEGATAGDDTWAAALADVRASEDDGSERLFSATPIGHQRLLRAVAADGRAYGASAAVLGLAPGTANAAIGSLIGEGQVVRRGDRLAIVDPLFADWIRRRFPLPA
jgi:hypothetical protein